MVRSVSPDVRVTIVWCTGNWDSPLRWQKERGHSEEEYWQVRRKLEASVEVPTADEADEIQFFPNVQSIELD
jgi:hypothetical protein